METTIEDYVGTTKRNPFPHSLPTTRRIRAVSALLGGSWVVISRVTSRITILTTYIRGLMTPLTITHGPPSNPINQRPLADQLENR